MSLKARQVAGVTLIVGLVVIVLSLFHLAALARVRLEESQARGEALSHAIFQQAYKVGRRGNLGNLNEGLRTDPGIRSLLESSIAYSKNVTYAAIVDSSGKVIAHSFPTQEGNQLPAQEGLDVLLQRSGAAQLEAIYSDRTFEVRQPLLLGTEQFGSIRIGVSTLLIQDDLRKALRPAVLSAFSALVIATLGAMLLSQWLLRPIHIIRSGLTRLGRGEFDVKLDLPPDEEFGELGTSFNSISAQLSAVHSRVGETANLKSVVEHLEDAVALFNPDRGLLFANSAMLALLGHAPASRLIDDLLPSHPCRKLVEQTLARRQPQGPISASLPAADGASAERLLMTHPIEGPDDQFVGVVLMARNVAYLGQVQSTLNYSRKLVALGRLLAGVAHEVKNPLNAMTIHLELLKQKLTGTGPATRPRRTPARALLGIEAGGAADVRITERAVVSGTAGHDGEEGARPVNVPAVMKHVGIISTEIARLDQVVQGFLKFTRPEELKLQPLELPDLIDDVVHVIEPEAQKAGVTIRKHCGHDTPSISGDPEMLHQALLNLSLNACQAMPAGGNLTIACHPDGERVALELTDTGTGIEPQHLEKIFDLYFTTKERGSGIGLSMVYRTVQLHDGDIEVHSTPAHGTTFRLSFPRA